MPRIFLSPSTQEYNPYVIGGNEELYMNRIADAMIPYLNASGIGYSRNNPNLNAAAAIAQANRGRYDLYLALHSNASPEALEGLLRGPDVYYYPTSTRGRRAANIIANGLREIYPDPELVHTRTTTELAEVRRPRAPAVLVEIAYHDNEQDANWIADNIDEIAENLAMSVADFLGVAFYTPSDLGSGVVNIRSGRLNVRSAPSTSSRVIGSLENGRRVDITQILNGWYGIRWQNGTGYVSSDFVRRA